MSSDERKEELLPCCFHACKGFGSTPERSWSACATSSSRSSKCTPRTRFWGWTTTRRMRYDRASTLRQAQFRPRATARRSSSSLAGALSRTPGRSNGQSRTGLPQRWLATALEIVAKALDGFSRGGSRRDWGRSWDGKEIEPSLFLHGVLEQGLMLLACMLLGLPRA